MYYSYIGSNASMFTMFKSECKMGQEEARLMCGVAWSCVHSMITLLHLQ